MDDKKMKELMIDYIDGRLTGELKGFVVKHINKSEDNRKEFEDIKETIDLLEHDKELEPDSTLRLEFLNKLESMEEEKVIPIGGHFKKYWQIAAVISVFALALFGGLWYNNQQKEERIMAMEEELKETKNMIMMALNENNSASERMLGVNASYDLKIADDTIVNALIRTMNTDKNSNVRLAAINALAKFSNEPTVRKALIKSLATQNDPIVQITLINLMVEIREKGALDELENIINDSTNVESVKDEAYMATYKLS